MPHMLTQVPAVSDDLEFKKVRYAYQVHPIHRYPYTTQLMLLRLLKNKLFRDTTIV